MSSATHGLAASPFQQLVREPTLSDKVSESLLQSVLSGRLEAGDRLPSERDLGAQFGVSRTVIREAVRSLVAKGVLDVRSGSGVRIATADLARVRVSIRLYLHGSGVSRGLGYGKVHDVREMIEIRSAGVACVTATDADLDALRAVHARMAAGLQDVEEASRQDVHRRPGLGGRVCGHGRTPGRHQARVARPGRRPGHAGHASTVATSRRPCSSRSWWCMNRAGARTMKIALFVTCLADTLFPESAKATVRLLERLGHEVQFPAGQTCCGQMHVNTGYQREALPLVRRHVDTFSPYDVVVAPSGSCVGSVRHQHAMVARAGGDERLAARAEAVAGRTFELSELLVDVLGVEDVGAYYPHRVTYHPTCHSLRLLRVGDKPLRLLRKVRGLELVELDEADQCCGFGGTFALKNADTSTAMLADKMRAVLATRAEVCTAGDSSCLMHIGGGLSRLRTGVRTVHLAEILASTEAGA